MDNKSNNDSDIINKRVVLLIVTLASFLTPFMSSSMNIALPSIGKEFSMNVVLLNWVATSYLLAAAIFLVPFGKIADIKGRKKVFSYGILIYALSSFLCAISTSSVMLISFRILQGIGSAMIFGTAVAILTSVFPPRERGKVLGINAAAVYLGLSLGPFLGGSLTQYLGWRSIFIANAVLGLITIILVLWKLKGDWAEAKGEKFDFIGSIVYSLSLAAIMYGFSLIPAMSGLWLVLVGVFMFLLFVRWEMKTKNPILDINLFRNNITFTFSNIAALINYSATFAVAFLLSLYLQYIKGFSPQNAGSILVAQPVVMAIFSPLAGRLSDRVEPGIIASAGMALTTVSLSLFTFLSEKTSLEVIVASLILLGFGLALFSSPNTNAIMSSVERRFYGVASATLATMRLTGQTLSMGIVMLIFAIYMGNVQITPQYYPIFLTSMKTVFIIFALLCFGGIFASLARGKVQ
ncbi:MFS transporter [Thermococcus sibiricus]|uniref:Putative transport protein n=2 Tax=Thermococcus sibiricus TaxID=172049 RepID=C6A2D6_THESM|nr:MFS transporter [Thermococcus sibiricus]ACS89781.1 putative transport protein [Thermococcus sibiricus MM 739]KUK17702.1 MAG: Putative transport protein [Thermococcus sibiricus]